MARPMLRRRSIRRTPKRQRLMPWERRLWLATQQFVTRACPMLSAADRQYAVREIYERMHKVLSLMRRKP
jgi:hypothetical protein